jgi:cell division protein FtsB
MTAHQLRQQLRRLERQIAAYRARQAALERCIQRLCTQHLALQARQRQDLRRATARPRPNQEELR